MLALLCGLVVGAWFFGQGQAVRLRVAAGQRPNSRAPYHGALCAAAAATASLCGWLVALAVGAGSAPQLLAVVLPGVLAAGVAGRLAGPGARARERAEGLARLGLLAAASLSLVITLGITLALVVEAALFFGEVSVLEFVLGTQWSPQTALRPGQAGADGRFGAVPVFAGTFLIAAVGVGLAAPVGVMIAIYLSEYASARGRAVLKPLLEVLTGIPPVVYGVFALSAVGPVVRRAGATLGLDVPVQSALAAGVAMALMILPLVSSLSDDVISAVPQDLRDGSTALGATRSETVRGVILPRALPGVAGAVLLAAGRAIGETMIVVIVASRAAVLTANPLESVTTVTVQIVALLTGDPVFDSAKTRAAFALGLALFLLTLALNAAALLAARRFRARAR